jgi:hypothetical protein
MNKIIIFELSKQNKIILNTNLYFFRTIFSYFFLIIFNNIYIHLFNINKYLFYIFIQFFFFFFFKI